MLSFASTEIFFILVFSYFAEIDLAEIHFGKLYPDLDEVLFFYCSKALIIFCAILLTTGTTTELPACL